jgi:hypothetical protein
VNNRGSFAEGLGRVDEVPPLSRPLIPILNRGMIRIDRPEDTPWRATALHLIWFTGIIILGSNVTWRD